MSVMEGAFLQGAEKGGQGDGGGADRHLVTLYAESWGACPMRGGLPGQGGKLLWVECAAKGEDEVGSERPTPL
ncbi:hypothetical protein NRF20_19185 [Streptomyces sp. R-74717]|uniref:hypothetical protein n=1 Tax=Streptomyces TaxID=1883 RepID=UPI0037AA55B3